MYKRFWVKVNLYVERVITLIYKLREDTAVLPWVGGGGGNSAENNYTGAS